MNIYKLSISQQKFRYLFTLIGLIIAGVVMIFSLFYTNSIKQSIIKTIPLKEDEIHLFVNENTYTKDPVNHYERLKNDFDVVIPFVKSDIYYIDEMITVVGTNLDGNKLLVDNKFIDINILEKYTTKTAYPKVIVQESLVNKSSEKIIELNEIDVEISGTFKLLDVNANELYQDYMIFSLDDYAKVIDSKVISEESGITKYLIRDYYIKNSFTESDAKQKIINIYNADNVLNDISTHNSLLKYEMNNFLLFTSIPTIFFILILIFSILNIFVSINLTIKERKHYYTILTILGMRLKHLKKMITIEISIVSIIASIGSLILGIITSLVVISFTKDLTFVWAPLPYLCIVMLAIIVVPIIQTIITIKFIKYKHIIN